ncbi:MAG: dienelactone hydrolase family protein [Alphaproteobacteria bacterium]
MATITIDASDGSGSFKAFVARPADGGGPAVIAIQEIFGINQVMRDICADLAEQGYIAVCPDLFWRQEPGIELTDRTEAEWGRAFQLYQGFDEAKGVDDLKATIAAARALQGASGAVGTVGYCLGGKLAYLCATRTDADCNVGYYGVGIEAALGEAGHIHRPLMLHIAEKDQFCPPEAQAQIKEALAKVKHVSIHSYAGMDHAFARPGGAHYDEDAAETANRRTREFFAKHLS